VIEPLRSPESELPRIGLAGVIWSAAELLAAAVVLSTLLGAGWHPAQLSPPALGVWIAGSLIAAFGLFSTVWAGCPVLVTDIAVEHRRKARWLRGGLAAYGIGGVVALLALLLG
jgi:hypothetical protein